MSTRHASGEGGGARGGADLRGRVEVGEGGPVFCELVEVWCFDLWVAGETEIAVTKIVGDDDEDIGLLFSHREDRGENQEEGDLGH